MLKIGVDVGGTNTDSVLIDTSKAYDENRGILAIHKSPTTLNISDGIQNAIRVVLNRSQCDRTLVSCITIGTTHFINAVLQHDTCRLAKVAVLRLCSTYTRQAPPFTDFPQHLRSIIEGPSFFANGGFEIDGKETKPLDELEIVTICDRMKDTDIKAIAVVGVFSSLDLEGIQEKRVRGIIRGRLGSAIDVVISSEVGQVGFLERENATILNASILAFARRTIRGFQQAITALGLKCPLFLTANDGTLISASKASNLPIRTFSSGMTNSMRGASFLVGHNPRDKIAMGNSMIVLDIGGTTTDVGCLLPSGLPRQAAAFVRLAGVRTAFAMPDLLSIGLGGGSRVRPLSSGQVAVGPDSVGHHITEKSLVFGGNELTATDISVATGRANVGDASLVSSIDASVLMTAENMITKLVEDVIDRMKTSPEPITVLLVGGGSILMPDQLKGVDMVVKPRFADVANAVGAAMSKVAGEIDRIEIMQGRELEDVLTSMKKEAVEQAINAGADPDTIEVLDVEILPLQYVTNQATRIIIKAAGELSVNTIKLQSSPLEPSLLNDAGTQTDSDVNRLNDDVQLEYTPQLADIHRIDPGMYRPCIDPSHQWIVSETDLEWIAEGCGILGTGGGGTSYPPFLMAREQLRQGKKICIVDPEDVSSDSLFIRACFMGSPSVSSERIQGGNELPAALAALKAYLGVNEVAGTISDEIGGGNGVQPLVLAAELGILTLDGDLMGRAYPRMDQTLPGVYGIQGGLWPCAIADGVGNQLVLGSASSAASVESILRAACTEMGSKAAVIHAPLTVKQCIQYGVMHSVSQAWRIGRAIAQCRKANDLHTVSKSILELQNGKCLFVGKIVSVTREIRAGFTWGETTIVPLQSFEEERAAGDDVLPIYPVGYALKIPFQNENVAAYLHHPDGSKEVLCTMPDLITVIDSQSGSCLGTPEYRYGLRVTVLALAGHPLWTKTEQGLKFGGPLAFGLDVPYTSVGEYIEPRSVIREFATA